MYISYCCTISWQECRLPHSGYGQSYVASLGPVALPLAALPAFSLSSLQADPPLYTLQHRCITRTLCTPQVQIIVYACASIYISSQQSYSLIPSNPECRVNMSYISVHAIEVCKLHIYIYLICLHRPSTRLIPHMYTRAHFHYRDPLPCFTFSNISPSGLVILIHHGPALSKYYPVFLNWYSILGIYHSQRCR